MGTKTELLRITEGGYWPLIGLAGDPDKLTTDGVIIDAPSATVVIGCLAVSHVRVPLIVRRVGRLVISDYTPHHFWGDTLNIRCSNIHISRLAPTDIQQRFSYDEYHQDLIFQAFAVLDNGWELDTQGVIENIHIDDIELESNLEQVNGIMLSERNQYRNFVIGPRRLHIGIEAPYWLSTNTLSDSVIGSGDTCIFSPSGRYQPTVRVQNVKQAEWDTQNVVLVGTDNAVVMSGVEKWERWT